MQFIRFVRTAFGGGTKLSAEDGFLQFMIERLLASSAPAEIAEDEDEEETGDEMKLTSIQSITDFMTCAAEPFRTTSVSGQEETLQLPVPTKYLRRKDAMLSELFPIMMNVQLEE